MNLSNNRVDNIRPLTDENHFKFLQTALLQGNKVSELDAIKCPNLVVLNLQKNHVSKLEKFDVEGLPKLEYLNLNQNRISDLTLIKDIVSLKTLLLAENKVKMFNGLGNLVGLKVLNLANNNVRRYLITVDDLYRLRISVRKISQFQKCQRTLMLG